MSSHFRSSMECAAQVHYTILSSTNVEDTAVFKVDVKTNFIEPVDDII